MLQAALALALLAGAASAATSPQQVDFQGKLLDASGAPRRGSFDITFRMFGAPAGGAALWSETQTGVPVENGAFDVKLGKVAALPVGLFGGGTVYLELQVSPEAAMSPRAPILMTPYAFRVRTADGLLAGDTDFIESRGTLQDGAVFRVSSATVEGRFLATRTSTFTAAGGPTYSLVSSSGIRVQGGTLDVEGAGGVRVSAVVRAATATAVAGLVLPSGSAVVEEGAARWDPALDLLNIGTATADATLLDTGAPQTAMNKALSSAGGNLVDATRLAARALSAVVPVEGMTLRWDAAASDWVPAYLATATVVTHNFTPTGNVVMVANVVYVIPFTIPGVLQLNEIRFRVRNRRTGCSGDVGLYDGAGNLVASGGTSSADCSTNGAKAVPVVGAPVTVYGGQYFAAITVDNTPTLTGTNLGAATTGVVKGLGTAAELGGTTLPASINLGTITDDALVVFMGFNN